MALRWLLVYDHTLQLVRDWALAIDLYGQGDLSHAGTPAISVEEAIRAVALERPEVVLLDLGLPMKAFELVSRDSGVQCAEAIRKLSPPSRIIMFSNQLLSHETDAECDRVRRLESVGTHGFLFPPAVDSYRVWAEIILAVGSMQPPPALVPVVHRVWWPDHMAAEWTACLQGPPHECDALQPLGLSARQHEAMFLAATGMTGEEIAQAMGIGVNRVNDLLYKAGGRTHAWEHHQRKELVIWARTHCIKVRRELGLS